MLSLSPRYDLFRFLLPIEFIPKEVRDKYDDILRKSQSVITSTIDLVNESIKGVTIPGLDDLTVDQQQISRRIGGGIEPKHDNTTMTVGNPIDKINKSITITFRHVSGFMNYFILFESIFHRILKNENYKDGTDLYIDLMDELGKPALRVFLFQCHIQSLEGLDLSMDKVERQTDTFSMEVKFNNIDIEFANVTRL